MDSYTLNLRGQPSAKLPRDLLSKEPTFVTRYWLVAEVISQLTGGKFEDRKIIDVGGNGSLLPAILDKKIDILDLPDNNYENYIQASALDMPLEDESYDIVTACDVYEHIPAKDRSRFIEELLRISRGYVVLCGPMHSPDTAAAEKRANRYFKEIFGRDHPWLEEHIAYTLPRPANLETLLKRKGFKFSKFDHNALAVWEMITKINLLMVDGNVAQEKAVAESIEELNSRYITKLGLLDFVQSGYRTVYIIQKDKSAKPIKLQLAEPDKAVTEEVARMMTNVLSNLAISFRDNRAELGKAKDEVAVQRERVRSVQAELDAVYASRGWLMLQALRKILRPAYRLAKQIRLLGLLRRLKRLAIAMLVRTPFVKQVLRTVRIDAQRHKNQRQREAEYREWVRDRWPDDAALESQRSQSVRLKKQPLISIIVPAYNTNHKFLTECIESVIKQSYENWELCIADDASDDEEVRRIILEYAKKDPRIKHVFRSKNGHISEASNSALKISSGEYVALLDHDDILWPNALYEVAREINTNSSAEFIYTDEDKLDETSTVHSEPFFKPAWSPDYLRSLNYITHFAVLKKSLVEKAGRFRKGYEGAQDWDLFLRASRLTNEIYHIPKVLYSWRKSDTSTALNASVKGYAYRNQKKALEDDFKSRGIKVRSLRWGIPNLMWRSEREIVGNPKVSIVIPTKDKLPLISACLKSIHKNSTYANIEIVVVDTGSTDHKVWELYDLYKNKFSDFQVVKWGKPFNFAGACNFGVAAAKGEYLLFLNNDTEVISQNWIHELLQHAQEEHVGAVGCKLLYPDSTLQHAGVVLGIGGLNGTPGVAAHVFPAYQDSPVEDSVQPLYIGGVRNFSAVTAACVMVARRKFEKVQGFDPEFQIAFNDVDFCLKLIKEGWFNVYTPYAKLFHHESVSVGVPGSAGRDIATFEKEIQLMGKKWGWDYIGNDPYYSPHFRKDTANFRLAL